MCIITGGDKMLNFQIEKNSDKAIYAQLKDAIKSAVADGKLHPMSKLPPVSQIAKDAGVSLRTADMALQELINEGVCFRRPKKGTFIAGIDTSRKQKICGILGTLNPVSYPLQTILYCGIMEAAARNNSPAFMIPLPEAGEGETPESVIRRCDRGLEFELKGIFVIDLQHHKAALELAKKFPSKRFILLNYQGEFLKNMPENVAAVVNDDFFGAHHLAEYVFSEYKVKTAVVLSIDLDINDNTYKERDKGIKAAARKNGVHMMKTIQLPRVSGFLDKQVTAAKEAVQELLNKKNRPDFIFAVNDALAHGAREVLKETGLQDEINVSGYDDLHPLRDSDIPSAKVLYTEMGKVGLQKILDPGSKMQCVVKLLPEIIKPVRNINLEN